MDCQLQDQQLSPFFQQVIFKFNHEKLRRYILRHHVSQLDLSSEVKYHPDIIVMAQSEKQCSIHELYVQKKKQQTLKSFLSQHMRNPKKLHVFTVAIVYQENRIHYVAFIADMVNKTLYCFDSGYKVYEHGTDCIIPHVRKCFESFKSISLLGQCGKGIQYNGETADAFCQTWSLFFLVRALYIYKSHPMEIQSYLSNMMKIWCKIPPKKREHFLFVHFLVPHLFHHEYVQRHIFQNDPTQHEIMTRLLQFVEHCR